VAGREAADAIHGLVRLQGRVHQFDEVHPGVGHVGEDAVENIVDIVMRARGGVDPGMGADQHLFGSGARTGHFGRHRAGVQAQAAQRDEEIAAVRVTHQS